MVAMTIALLVIGAVVSVFMTVNRSIFGLSDAIALNSRTRLIQERIGFDLRNIKTLSAISSQSFNGTVVDFATGNTNTVTYTLADGALKRSINGGTAVPVMTALVTDPTATTYSLFRYSNRLGTVTTSSDISVVRAIRFDLVPAQSERQQKHLVTGSSDPFCSALFQLRNLISAS